MRTWMTETNVNYGTFTRVLIDMPDYYPVSIYKDTTGQYTDEEIDNPCELFSNIVEIPVPKDLLLQWFTETWNYDKIDFNDPDVVWFGLTKDTVKEDLKTFVYEESDCDDTVALYSWLVAHGYQWKRLD